MVTYGSRGALSECDCTSFCERPLGRGARGPRNERQGPSLTAEAGRYGKETELWGGSTPPVLESWPDPPARCPPSIAASTTVVSATPAPTPEPHASGPPPPNQGGSDDRQALRWVFGVLILLMGLSSPYPMIWILWVGMGLVLIPPTAALIERKTGLALHGGLRRKVLIGGFVLTLILGALSPEPAESERDRAGFWGRFFVDYANS